MQAPQHATAATRTRLSSTRATIARVMSRGHATVVVSSSRSVPMPVRLERNVDDPEASDITVVLTPHPDDAWNGGEPIHLDFPAEALDSLIDSLTAVRDAARDAGVLTSSSGGTRSWH